MLQHWVIRLAIGFVMRQIVKFGKEINWQKVRDDVATRVADLLPGQWFDAEGVALAHAVVEACATVLRDTKRIEQILTLLAQEKQTEALSVTRDLILSAWVPQTKPQLAFAQTLAQKPQLFVI